MWIPEEFVLWLSFLEFRVKHAFFFLQDSIVFLDAFEFILSCLKVQFTLVLYF